MNRKRQKISEDINGFRICEKMDCPPTETVTKEEIMKKIDLVRKVSGSQIEFGRRLGLSLEDATVSVADAMIYEVFARDFYGTFLSPTKSQVELAASLGYEVSGEGRLVVDSVIRDILKQRNRAAVRSLSSGMKVKNITDGCEYVVSSVRADGRVCFEECVGKAWASDLTPVS